MRGLSVVLQSFQERNFARYVAGNSISLVGNWMQRTTIAWLIWDMTQSASWLGLIAFADLFPAIVIGPFGGVLADRVRRQYIILTIQSVMLVLSLVLAVLAYGGWLDPFVLLAIVLLHGVLVGVNQPARLAFVSLLLPPSLLSTGVAINSVVFNTARFIGPAVAGILLVTIGAAGTFLVNCLTFVPLLWVLAGLRLPQKLAANSRRRSLLAAISEGFRYLWDHADLRPLLALFLVFSMLVRPISELLPAVADGRFALGALGLAWLSSALGVGAMLGGLSLATNPQWVSIARYRFWLAAATVFAAAFVLAPTFLLATLGIGFCGLCFVMTGVGANTIIQSEVPDELRGRVLSLYGIIMRAAPALGALVLGGIADLLGLVTAVIGATLLFALVLAAALLGQKRH